MTGPGIVSLGLWVLASLATFAAASRRLLSVDATRFESLAIAASVSVLAPPLVAQWVWMVPLGANEHVVVASLVTIVAAVAAVNPLSPIRPGRTLFPRTLKLEDAASALAVSVLIAGLALYSGFVALLKPVDEWDALTYHGPTVIQLVTERSLFGWHLGSSFGFYPNLTAFMGAPLVAASRSTRFLDGVQIAPWVGLVLVAWAWAGRGKPRLLPGVLVTFAASAPPIFTQLRSLGVDVTYGSAVLTGLFCGSLWWQRRDDVYLRLAVISLAAALAAKPAGALLAAWIGAVVVLVAAVRRTRASVTALLATVTAGVLGSTLYLRNWIEFGNPVYPVEVAAGPIRLDGLFDSAMFYDGGAPAFGRLPPVLSFARNLLEGILNEPDFYTWDMRSGGYWMWPLGSAIVAVLGLTARVARTRAWPGRPSRGAAVLVGAAVLLLLAQPQSWYPRYTIAVFLLIAIGAARLADRDLPSRVAVGLALVLAGVGLGLVRHVEHRFNAGFGVVETTRQTFPGYGDTFGAGPTYGAGFDRIASAPCGTRILVDANERQRGRYSTFSLGLWGDTYCNQVTFVHQDRQGADALFVDLGRYDFAVVDEAELARFTTLAATQGLEVTPAAGPLELSGSVQTVVALQAAAPSDSASTDGSTD